MSRVSMYSQAILIHNVVVVPGFTMEMACDSPTHNYHMLF